MNTETAFTIECPQGSIKATCPDENSEMHLILMTSRSRKVFTLSLEDAKALGTYLKDHAKYALKANPQI